MGFQGDILTHRSHITATLSLLGNWKQKSQKVSNLQSWQWHDSCCSWNINSEHIAAGFILCGSTRRHLFNKAAAVWILNIHTRLAGSNSRHTYRSIKSRLYKHRLIGPLWSDEPASLNNAQHLFDSLLANFLSLWMSGKYNWNKTFSQTRLPKSKGEWTSVLSVRTLWIRSHAVY